MFSELFLFAQKMKFLTKGGIHCISRSSLGTFCSLRGHLLVELAEHDDSAANINVHTTVVCVHLCPV